jgi:hypothetical protein
MSQAKSQGEEKQLDKVAALFYIASTPERHMHLGVIFERKPVAQY